MKLTIQIATRLFIFVYFLLLVFGIFQPSAIAQTPDQRLGAYCNEEAAITCQTGLDCVNNVCIDPNAGNTGGALQEGDNCGGSITAECDATQGLSCVSGKCSLGAVPPPNNGGGNSSTQMSCPEGLSNQNGICLPKNSAFPTTGLAGSTTLVDLITKVIQLLLFFSGIIAVVFLVLGGYWYMASGGNEELAEKGKKTIVNFVMGLVVIIMAYAIVTILFNTLTTSNFTP